MEVKIKNKYKDYQERFKNMSNAQLIATLNEDMGKPGWVSSRAIFYSTLREEFGNRGLDYSAISKKLSKSKKRKSRTLT